mgnify:CR=1 FL=1
MASTTTNLGLPLTGTSSGDTGMLFSAWRQLINGEGSSSGFNMIDAAIGALQESMAQFKFSINETDGGLDITIKD